MKSSAACNAPREPPYLRISGIVFVLGLLVVEGFGKRLGGDRAEIEIDAVRAGRRINRRYRDLGSLAQRHRRHRPIDRVHAIGDFLSRGCVEVRPDQALDRVAVAWIAVGRIGMRLHAGKDLAPLQPDRFPVFQPGNGKAEQAVAGLLGNIDRQQDHAGAGNGPQPQRTRFCRDPHALSPALLCSPQ
jgi:hypothetical protein